MTRKEFLAVSAAFAAVGPHAAFAKPVARPLMRLGMIADVHLETGENGKGVQNCLCYEPALRYFDERKADGVVVAGDITDFGTGAALRQIAETWFKVFPGNRRSDGKQIVPLFIYGDHDMGGYMHKSYRKWAESACTVPGELDEIISDGDNAARLWKECFHEDWAPIQVKECCGFKFVLAHHPLHTKESDNGNSIPGLAGFMAKQGLDPKKPFFFVQHRVFKNTVLGEGCGWESGKTTGVLRKYPNAIALCGHGHINAVDDLCLWQNEFTAMQIPSLNLCCTRPGRENGYNSSDKDAIMPKAYITKSWQGMFGTMYADRFVVERRDFLNGLPLGPDWVVPLPSPDGSLRTDVRTKRAVAPQFAKGAAISLSETTVVNRARKSTDAVVVSFPVAHATAKTPRAFDYVVTAKKGGAVLKEKFVFPKGQFWADEKDVKPVECALAKSDLPEDWRTAVKFEVAPRDAFGNCGRWLVVGG